MANVPAIASSAPAPVPDTADRSRILEQYARLPLSFIENRGQADARIDYYLQSPQYDLHFDRGGHSLRLTDRRSDTARAHVVKVRLLGAKTRRIESRRSAPGIVSYFKGPASQWRTGIQTQAEIGHVQPWPGIDLGYNANGGTLESVYTVAPHADPRRIRLRYSGHHFATAAIQPNASKSNEGAPCTDCTSTPMPVLGGGGLLGLRTMLTAMSFAAVFTDEEGGELRKDVTSPADIPGVGKFLVNFEINGKPFPTQATGFLINECLVMTNKHVVERHGKKPTIIKFQAGTNFQYEAIGKVIASGNYSKDDAKTYHEDWAVVKLDKKLANQVDSVAQQKIGFLDTMFTIEEELLSVDDIGIVGFISDKVDKENGMNVNTLKMQGCGSYDYVEMYRFNNLTDEGVDSGTVATDCSSLPGASGSPMFRMINGKYLAVGIMKNSIHAGRVWELSSDNSNIFVPFIKYPSIPLSLSEAKLEAIKNDPANKCN